MAVDALTTDAVLTALAREERTAVPTASLAATLEVPTPYLTTHLQQLALRGLVGFNTHRGVRRWRLTATGRAATADQRSADTGAPWDSP